MQDTLFPKNDHLIEKQLGELAELKGRIGWCGLTAKEYTQKGPFFLSVYSLNYGDYVDFRDAFHISEERYAESPEIMLKEGDILICKDGAGIEKCGIVGEIKEKTTINSSLLLIRSSKDVLPKYLYRFLCSPSFQKIVNSQLDGSTTPHLYQHVIKKFPILLPSISVQMEIIDKLDSLREDTKQIEKNYQQKLVEIDALKKSILQKTFNGEL
ncbi:MAG: restriction endonuclease subunit S [Chloroflexi bacterium]|nr:restriction endonuclease subunit S [Chloroflexota bacterium]